MNMLIEFLKLAEIIKQESQGDSIIFVSADGNWGDALIKKGIYAFFNHFNIAYKELSFTDSLSEKLRWRTAPTRNKVAVFAGGGAWCNHFSFFAEATHAASKKFTFKKTIILPSSYEISPNIERCIAFRRDNYESKASAPESIFCHDMALFLPKHIVTDNLRTLDKGIHFREDIESLHASVPDHNIDLSTQGHQDSNIHPFLEKISQCKHIHTDRLHVAIGAYLTNTPVSLYPGKYFKNRAVYHSSLKHIHNNITFNEKFEEFNSKT